MSAKVFVDRSKMCAMEATRHVDFDKETRIRQKHTLNANMDLRGDLV